MAWIESHQTLREHPKLTTLSEKLEITKAQAIGHLHMLWWWCIDYADDGHLDRYSEAQICSAAGFQGDFSEKVPQIIEALISAGFLETQPLRVHDWLDFCGDLVKKRLEYRKAKRRRSKRLGDSLRKTENSQRTVTVPAVPDQTNQITPAREILSFFNSTCGTALTLTKDRESLIARRLDEGRTVAELKSAILTFSKDDWPDRKKYMDLVYAIGVRSKIDNLDKWLNTTIRRPQEQRAVGVKLHPGQDPWAPAEAEAEKEAV